MARAKMGECGALPCDGANEGDEVPRREATSFPCEEAGAEGMATALRKV
jgi:hypothetical protein